MSTIRDVAKEAGVSITSVSKILSNDPTFRATDETRARVLETARALNYRYAARTNQIHIGCIMSLTYSYSDPYFNDILNGIQAYCSTHNATISLIVSYAQFQEMNAGLEKQLSELDGLIITDLPEEHLDLITRYKAKIVFVDNFVNGFCNVGYNSVYANQLIMEHLLDCGYTQIAYIGGSSDHCDFLYTSRMMVFRESLLKRGLSFNPELLYDCNWNSELCAKQVKELLTKHPNTQVIFAGSDSLAIVILAQLNKMGIKCPEDIGVIGCNDIDLAQNFVPPLTTVRLPSVEMGQKAAEVLIQQIKNNTTFNIEMLLPVELKIRKSTRKIL